jgi:zinc protease
MTKSILLATCLATTVGLQAAEVAPLKDTYAIVATASVANDPEWRAATIEKLQAKYPEAKLFVWNEMLNEILPAVREMQPTFTAFVGKPEEMSRRMVMSAHYFSRMLDDDPYTDTFWGLVTGYDAASAALVAGATDFSIERAMDCSGTDLKSFNEAWRYSEDHRGTMKYWKRGMADVEASECDTDNTQGVLERLQKDKIQFLATSGHATEHDWQMGYCGPNMQMRHKEGALVAIDTKEQAWAATSTEPKVYFANGNCLIGNIDQVDCMALSWMRDGGVRQMMGYTVTTWFGAQGWGALGLYVDHSGLCTAAEAFHFTNTTIVQKIASYNIPDMMTWRWGKVGHMNTPMTRGMVVYSDEKAKVAQGDKHTLRALQDEMKEKVGNLHDRDSVAFYGDPALKTYIANGRLTVHAPKMEEDALVLSLSTHEGLREGPAWFRLPGSWNYDPALMVTDEALGKPSLTLDNMLYFDAPTLEPGKTYTVKLPKATRKGTF